MSNGATEKTNDARFPSVSGERLCIEVEGIIQKLSDKTTISKAIALNYEIEENSEEFFETLHALHKLFLRTQRDVKDSNLQGDAKIRLVTDIESVKSAFHANQLGMQGANARTTILNSDKVGKLYYIGTTLQGRLGENVILASELEDIKHTLKKALAEIVNSDIPDYTQIKLANSINSLLYHIDHCNLFGPETIEDETVSAIGQLGVGSSLDVSDIEKAKRQSIFSHLVKVLEWANKAATSGRNAEYMLEKLSSVVSQIESSVS